MIGIAGDVTSAIKGAFFEIGDLADNLGESAEKIGVSTEFLSGIGAAFDDAGSSAEGLADSIKFLNKNAADAASGNKEAIASFEKLGLSADFVRDHLGDSETLFFAVADGIAGMSTAAQKTEAAMGLLGRGGSDALAALNKGSGGLKQFSADIEKLGAVIHSDLAEAGDSFGTLTTLAGAALEGIKIAAAQPLLEGLHEHFDEIKEGIIHVAEVMRTAISGAIDWVVANMPDIKSAVVETIIATTKGIADLVDFVNDQKGLFGFLKQTLFEFASTAKSFAESMGLIAEETESGGAARAWADQWSQSFREATLGIDNFNEKLNGGGDFGGDFDGGPAKGGTADFGDDFVEPPKVGDAGGGGDFGGIGDHATNAADQVTAAMERMRREVGRRCRAPSRSSNAMERSAAGPARSPRRR